MGLQTEDQSPVDVFLWGDSHANCLFHLIDRLCQEANLTGKAALQNATLPVYDYSFHPDKHRKTNAESFGQAVRNTIANARPTVVILAARWNTYLENPKYDSGKTQPAIHETVRLLAEEVPRVIFVTQVPEPGFDVPRKSAYRAWHSPNSEFPFRTPEQESSRAQRQLIKKLSELPKVEILDLADSLLNSKGTRYEWVADEGCLFTDDNHLSITGLQRLEPELRSVLLTLSNEE